MNEKKNFYEELYGEISKQKKTEVNMDNPDGYKLNFALVMEIFGQEPTELYRFFASSIFGIDEPSIK